MEKPAKEKFPFRYYQGYIVDNEGVVIAHPHRYTEFIIDAINAYEPNEEKDKRK